MKNKQLIVFFSLLFNPLFLKADLGCITISTVNDDTFVREQHPLGPAQCNCPCTATRWSDSSRCYECNHKHRDAQVIQTAKTNGTFVNFVTPAQAVQYQPDTDARWLKDMMTTAAEKQGHSSAPLVTSAVFVGETNTK